MGKSTLSKRRGAYGRSKYRAFTILEQLGQTRGRGGYLGTRELCILAGLPYRSLTKLLPKWVAYEYVCRRVTAVVGRGDYEYRLLVHGSAWLDCANAKLYNRQKFHDALKLWVNAILPYYDILLDMSFNSMVAFVGALLHIPPGQIGKQALSFDSSRPFM